MTIEKITIKCPSYQAERELRNRVLLRPIGIPDYGWEMRDAESHHFVAKENDSVLGCVLLYPLPDEPNRAQLLQMAVTPDSQKQGIGKKLLRALINFCPKIGVNTIFCHSRLEVVKFYEKAGFRPVGEKFTEVGLGHQKMEFQLPRIP